jgi:hypothetical protein
MKKILTLSAFVLLINYSFAGDGENDLKNFRFGLKVTPSVNWYKPEGKLISQNGVGAKFGGGLILEFRLAKVISIQTGAQIDLDGGKIKYNNAGLGTSLANSVSYYYNNIDEKIEKYSIEYANKTGYTHYQLNERQYKISYITIPLSLKMKTKEIGMFTYYGQIGVNSSIRWKASANDELAIINDATNTVQGSESKSKVDITKDVNLFNENLNFGLGAEMNLSGSTSFTFGLNYNLGFTNAVRKESDYLERRVNNSAGTAGTLSKMPQVIKGNAVILTVGILF